MRAYAGTPVGALHEVHEALTGYSQVLTGYSRGSHGLLTRQSRGTRRYGGGGGGGGGGGYIRLNTALGAGEPNCMLLCALPAPGAHAALTHKGYSGTRRAAISTRGHSLAGYSRSTEGRPLRLCRVVCALARRAGPDATTAPTADQAGAVCSFAVAGYPGGTQGLLTRYSRYSRYSRG